MIAPGDVVAIGYRRETESPIVRTWPASEAQERARKAMAAGLYSAVVLSKPYQIMTAIPDSAPAGDG